MATSSCPYLSMYSVKDAFGLVELPHVHFANTEHGGPTVGNVRPPLVHAECIRRLERLAERHRIGHWGHPSAAASCKAACRQSTIDVAFAQGDQTHRRRTSWVPHWERKDPLAVLVVVVAAAMQQTCEMVGKMLLLLGGGQGRPGSTTRKDRSNVLVDCSCARFVSRLGRLSETFQYFASF